MVSVAGPSRNVLAAAAQAPVEDVAEGFAGLPGWLADDHAAAFATFLTTCPAIIQGRESLRGALPAPAALRDICAAALAADRLDRHEARRFFELHFQPWRVGRSVDGEGDTASGAGFLTGYFEPEVEASLIRAPGFEAPLFARPEGLENRPAEVGSDWPGDLAAAWRSPDGRLVPFPERGTIAAGRVPVPLEPVAWLRDEVAAFVIHVQGSARLRLPDGGTIRVAYAGRNGHPYRSIGRILVEEGHLPRDGATMDKVVDWLRRDPAAGRAIMHRNPSFIFFRRADELDPVRGPQGGAGVQLTPLRSIAIDRTLWPYGLPFWMRADLTDVTPEAALLPGGEFARGRLVIGQDTGTAIVGPARADLFVGSGDAAGFAAGRIRHRLDLIVLLPRGLDAARAMQAPAP
jgi:membrane-bound lytic murein transglycosylase A